jgi:preprotein translocase SecF subunit
MIAIKGLKYTIDFTGGLSLEIAPNDYNKEFINAIQVREALEKNGINNAEIQELTKPKDAILIKAKNEEKIGDRIITILSEEYPEIADNIEKVSQEEVGPKAGADLREKAIKAVLLSLLFILIYIWFRFRFTWGFIAAFALFHDIIITLGIISLTGKEIGMTVLAALLTIVGYSINNTIVIFDRIRDDLKLYSKDSEYSVLNRSTSSVLNRTILTASTTLLANIALIVFGGSSIFDFGFTFMIGICVGTFSSIFVASGLVFDMVIFFKKNKTTNKR